MKNVFSICIALIAWFAVLTQYYLMIENRVASIGETTIRFFSFFTILTNSLVAIYFTLISFKIRKVTFTILKKPGTLTAITSYITIVGLVYQIILRHLWHPTGLQMVVDELLHTAIPIIVMLYWYLYENKSPVHYRNIPNWLIYPLLYLFYILIRGSMSNFYPFPFVDVSNIGITKVIVNSIFLMALFAGILFLLIRVGKTIKNQ